MTLSERQLEIENLLRSANKGEAIPDNVIAEIIEMVEKPISPAEGRLPESNIEETIKLKMLEEPDWRKRAQMAAMLISKSLE